MSVKTKTNTMKNRSTVQMRKYLATYQSKQVIVHEAVFTAETRQEAIRFADFHKRHTPEITKHKYVRTNLRKIK